MTRWIVFVTAIAAFAPAAGAQQYQRRATIVNGGDRDHGKCTVEVVVDGVADIEIRGDQGSIRNISGQPAQWRRFECTAAMPFNAADFHFAGVDGRGHQQLMTDPRNGGAAVVRIEDPQSGSEGYTFDLTWSGGNNNPGSVQRGTGDNRYSENPGAAQRGMGDNRYPVNSGTEQRGTGDNRYPVNSGTEQRGSENRNLDNRYGGNAGVEQRGSDNRNPGQVGRFTTEQAVGVCQESVRQQARTRFRGRTVQLRETRIDDSPGRGDWVVGLLDIARGPRAAEEHLQFACSVNFDTGQVRSVQLDPMGAGYRQGSSDRQASQRAIETCQQAVRSRVQRDGYGQVEFQSVRMDDQPGRDDWVIGSVRADRDRRSDSFNFSCAVNLRDGDVRSVDVTRR